ncbi:hypothetical protein MYAM1_003903 [Malassezia yamatoensis]|uniref:Kinetochore protein Sos7 coiled-coil domain-containing protein n=1 Tax=Malassezia yamatoensis TaxID=253288 RepID=A0AAJ6CKW2_9BASI|nr:hypothetical protein MYAM1_003903 [Malassezia yamatoensis]
MPDRLHLRELQTQLAQYSKNEGAMQATDLDLDWEMYMEVDGSLEQEEALLLDYFRKLKFIYLEQETKLRFLADLQDDPETGQEPQILSATDVAQREQECRRVKQQLVEAKKRVRDLRQEIDTLADDLHEPYDALDQGVGEARQLITEISDMELELARSKAAEGTHSCMTTAEAEAKCDEQILEMQKFDDLTTQNTRELEHAKKQLAESLKQHERLKLERSTAEKMANEAKLGTGHDRGRDWELERICGRHQTMIQHLYEALGIQSIHAPSDNELVLEFGSESTTLRLILDEVGGALVSYSVTNTQGDSIDLGKDTIGILDAAMNANLPATIAQQVWQDVD